MAKWLRQTGETEIGMLDSQGFDLWADGYDREVGLSDGENTYPFAGYREALDGIFRRVMEKPGASVLDIGFGTGTLTAKLYERGCAVYGQDFSMRMVEIAAAKMPGARLYQGDFSEGLVTPLRERRYDFIVSTYALHHMTDARKIPFLRDLRDFLAEDGRILIGDIAFPSRAELDRCRQAAGSDWDPEEYYFVADELAASFPDLAFTPVSFCAGILTLS